LSIRPLLPSTKDSARCPAAQQTMQPRPGEWHAHGKQHTKQAARSELARCLHLASQWAIPDFCCDMSSALPRKLALAVRPACMKDTPHPSISPSALPLPAVCLTHR
jgi:hypothetical protein